MLAKQQQLILRRVAIDKQCRGAAQPASLASLKARNCTVGVFCHCTITARQRIKLAYDASNTVTKPSTPSTAPDQLLCTTHADAPIDTEGEPCVWPRGRLEAPSKVMNLMRTLNNLYLLRTSVSSAELVRREWFQFLKTTRDLSTILDLVYEPSEGEWTIEKIESSK